MIILIMVLEDMEIVQKPNIYILHIIIFKKKKRSVNCKTMINKALHLNYEYNIVYTVYTLSRNRIIHLLNNVIIIISRECLCPLINATLVSILLIIVIFKHNYKEIVRWNVYRPSYPSISVVLSDYCFKQPITPRRHTYPIIFNPSMMPMIKHLLNSLNVL